MASTASESKRDEVPKSLYREQKTSGMVEPLYNYVTDHLRVDDVLKRLAVETEKLGRRAVMQISADEGQFLRFLVQLIGAKRTIEVGTFTGYSTLCTAQGLPADGKVIACDISEEWTSVGKAFWKEAGVEDKIDLRIAPAAETLAALIEAGETDTFDFAFIDADKNNYDTYYEQCLKLVRVGGVIAVDNVIWHGKVADATVNDEDTLAIRALNDKILADKRVDMCLIPVADGVTLVRRVK